MQLFSHNLPQNRTKILDYTYTSQPSINTALPLQLSRLRTTLFILACICTLGFIWLLAKWSPRKRAIMMYSVCQIDNATHFLIEEEDTVGGATLVKRDDQYDVKRRSVVVSFTYHDRRFLYHDEKDVFLPIRYEDLGSQLDKLQKGKFQPSSTRSRRKLLEYYGHNQIKLEVQNSFQIFIQEMLTPYQVFQMYAIILWISEQYYIFSVLLLAYSLYTYWANSKEVVQNQKKLAQKSFFKLTCKVLTKSKTTQQQQQIGNDSQDYTIIEQIRTQSQQNYQHKQMNEQEIAHKNGSSSDRWGKSSNSLNFHYSVQNIESKNIIPGDVIILQQGDVVPCDCVIIRGEAIVDESYISGQNYLIRKVQLQNYEYSKDRQKMFLLYLGTNLVKTRSIPHLRKQNQSDQTIPQPQLFPLQQRQIMCIVTQTNYNTQRGKYLRAIRYQKKPVDNFTRQSIYFIYIIIAITVIVFAILLPVVRKGQTSLNLVVLFLDLLATSIPITLPTALGVGISFAQHRLLKVGIHSILPSNILSAGRATTIVLDSNKVLSRNYQVSSIMVGTKNQSIGYTYSSLSQFLQVSNPDQESPSYIADPQKKQHQLSQISQTGRMLLRAFSVCHTLQRYNNELSGMSQERYLYEFAAGKQIEEDLYECLGGRMRVLEKVYFREREKKLAVVVEMREEGVMGMAMAMGEKVMGEEKGMMEFQEGDIGANKGSVKVIFMKGPPSEVIKVCQPGTYPKNYNDYTVDISEKGFKAVCYAFKNINPKQITKISNQLKEGFIFAGFALLQAQKKQDTIQAISQLKKSKMQIFLMSDQKQLESSSLAISNGLCTKNDLIICRLQNGVVSCSGHMEWQSDGSGNDLNEFIMESDSLMRNSYLSLNSKLYEELFMKREENGYQRIFNKTRIFNEMESRHVRNVYFQLDKMGKISFAVGSGSNVSECAHLSMQLERGQCSMLSSFHTNEKTLKCVKDCLIICRAALATNFHCFSMMILFSMVQFTTVSNLYFYHQALSDFQMLYEDLFVTFPIFITLNMTSPVSHLSKQLPPQSFFSPRALASMIGQFFIQLITQILFARYVFTLEPLKQEMQNATDQFFQSSQFVQTNLTLATFVLTNYLYLGIVLSTSVSKPFRKPFYTNPFYTLTLVVLWLYNTAIVLMPQLVPSALRPKDLNREVEEVLVLAMLLGNLVMIVMYLYENCLIWATGAERVLRKIVGKRRASQIREM